MAIVCDNCEAPVNDKVADYSKANYDGKIFCYNCQQEQPKVKKWPKKQSGSGYNPAQSKEAREDKAIGVLTSYATEIVVAKLQYFPKDKLSGDIMKAFWTDANSEVWESFEYFTKKVKGDQK